MAEPNITDATERLIRLEEQQHSSYRLTCQIADNADKTAQALQELVLIHKETSLRSEADRQNIQAITDRLDKSEKAIFDRIDIVERRHEKLDKIVWRVIWAGTGVAGVLSLLWYSGLLSVLIQVHDM